MSDDCPDIHQVFYCPDIHQVSLCSSRFTRRVCARRSGQDGLQSCAMEHLENLSEGGLESRERTLACSETNLFPDIFL